MIIDSLLGKEVPRLNERVLAVRDHKPKLFPYYHNFLSYAGCIWENLLYFGRMFRSYIVQPTKCTCYLKLFILVKPSACFGRSFRPSSGAQNCVYSSGICQTVAVIGDETELQFHLIPNSSSCLTYKYIVAVYAVLSS